MGELKLKTNHVGAWMQVVSLASVPGLCFDFSRSHFGVACGFSTQERLVVVPINAISNIESPDGIALKFSSHTNRLVGFGYLHMTGVPKNRREVIISGEALAGLGIHAGCDDGNLNVGVNSKERVSVRNSNIRISIDQECRRWCGYDLFSTVIELPIETAINDCKQP